MYDENALRKAAENLDGAEEKLAASRVLIGFDGYVDRVYRLAGKNGAVDSVSGFAALLGTESGDFRVVRVREKMGGNGPLLAESLAAKDVPLTCAGMMGEPGLLSTFAPLAEHCEALTAGRPADCFALEFPDGKMMLGDTDPLEELTFDRLCERVGSERLFQRLDGSDLFCFTNWSGLPHANELLERILREFCSRLGGKPRCLFFDLADPSALEQERFSRFFELLEAFQERFTVVVGLNPKELREVCLRFFDCLPKEPEEKRLEMLLARFPADELVLHGLDYAAAGDRQHGVRRVPGRKMESPAIVTGGGDNFNAGYCLGKLLALAPEQCALLGNVSSGLYVETGVPAGLSQMRAFCRGASLRENRR